jgi:ankyrin repeat protein
MIRTRTVAPLMASFVLVVIGTSLWNGGRQAERYEELADAVDKGDVLRARTLLEQGADPNAFARPSIPVLIQVVRGRDVRLTRMLLEHGADANTRDDLSGKTALMIASELGYEDVVKVLMEYGARLDISFKAETALSLARKNYHTGVVRLLTGSDSGE